jgi:8-amino-7-oxononanoate synthase
VLPSLSTALATELEALSQADRLRSCPPLSSSSRATPLLGDRPVISFASNDYLGLAGHPALARAAATAAEHSGFGASASRLISGDLPEHRALEAALSTFFGTEAALLFPTGYQANIGVITALAGPEDLIVSDAANHASLIDGCRLSRAEVVIFAHRDSEAAADALRRAPGRHRRRLLVTESLFSMDGDLAPLPQLAEVAREYDAALVVDEAHAAGVLGPHGAGLCRQLGLQPDVLIATLGKAFGSQGGVVAGPSVLRDILVNRARTFIFTTASPPPVVAAAQAALELIAGAEGDARRRALQANINALAEALPEVPHTGTPITPFLLGTDRAALAASAALRSEGLFIPAIRPPTVPDGTARLRISLSSAHAPSAITRLSAALRALPR